MLERYVYAAYGEPAFLNAAFGAIADSNYEWETLFASYRYDHELSFYLVRNRWLLPLLGQWASRDRRFATQRNLYQYAGSRPIATLDPQGRAFFAPQTEPAAGPHFGDNGGCSDDDEHDEVACITRAFSRAMGLLQGPGSAGCFTGMLKKIGSRCKSSDLRDCLISSLNAASFICDSGQDWQGLTQGPCLKGKTAQWSDPAGPCCGAPSDPAFNNCSACRDMSSTITLTRLKIEVGDLEQTTYLDYFCDSERSGDWGTDCLAGLLIHEAAHNCVGSHDYAKGGSKFSHVTNGIAHDPCGRPDAYEIPIQLFNCMGVPIVDRCRLMGFGGRK